MKDRLGRIIYVGKAKSLKKRVSSYFQRGRARTIAQPKIRALIDVIYDLDTIEVKSEPEALLLEGRLIKQWKPRYNTDFTDDKRFLLVRVDFAQELPRFALTRIRKDPRSRYFGPFAHSGLLRKTLAQIRRQYGVLLADSTPQAAGNSTTMCARKSTATKTSSMSPPIGRGSRPPANSSMASPVNGSRVCAPKCRAPRPNCSLKRPPSCAT